jgi:hypothetical protein
MFNQVETGSLLNSLNIEFLVKPILILFVLGYILFALVIVRQVNLMSAVLGTNLSPILKTFAWLHLLGSVFVLMVVLIIL